MVRTYLIIAFRNIIRNKLYSLINIIGLGFGLACFILICLWIKNEAGYDRFHRNADQIYRVIRFDKQGTHFNKMAVTPPPLGPALKSDFPEVLEFSRYNIFFGEVLIKHDENAFYEKGGAYVDPSFLEMFSISFIKGDPETALSEPASTIITESMARKYFGDREPVNQVLILENFFSLKVTGVIQDIPATSHLHFDFLVPYKLLTYWGKDVEDWEAYPDYTYLLLHPDAKVSTVNGKISGYLAKWIPEEMDELQLQPLRQVHLSSGLVYDEMADKGSRVNVVIFGIIAVVLLLIASVNFVNLTLAVFTSRFKEIGLRKVLGASGGRVSHQLMIESGILILVAIQFSLILVELSLQPFHQLTGKQFGINYFSLEFILFLLVIFILLILLTSIYPALYMASKKPLFLLRGYQNQIFSFLNHKSPDLRKSLVVFQNVLAVSMIIATMLIYKQLHFIYRKELGFNPENMIYIQLRGNHSAYYRTLKNELLRHPGVINITAASNLSTIYNMTLNNVRWEGRNSDESINIYRSLVDYDFFKTFNIQVVDGRAFSPEYSSDSIAAIVINEKAARMMDMKLPVGKKVFFDSTGVEIIGVVRNYHITSLHEEIKPLVLTLNTDLTYYMFIRVDEKSFTNVLEYIREQWKSNFPDFPFNFSLMNDLVHERYTNEQKLSTIMKYFSFIAIFTSILGLFALSAFVIGQKTKEIVIRKTFGASTSHIFYKVSNEFIRLVILANLISWPFVWFIAGRWLQNFAYRMTISWWIFILTAVLTVFISWVSVIYQSYTAAARNPVDKLRYE